MKFWRFVKPKTLRVVDMISLFSPSATSLVIRCVQSLPTDAVFSCKICKCAGAGSCLEMRSGALSNLNLGVSSFPRRRESSVAIRIPACAGMTSKHSSQCCKGTTVCLWSLDGISCRKTAGNKQGEVYRSSRPAARHNTDSAK